MTIWLVVLEDRHIDDIYSASLSREGAERIASKFMETFWDGRYRADWKREDDNEKANRVFVHRTFDDGPVLHIETVEVEGGSP